MQELVVGYFSFKDVIEDGEKALDAGLYRIALMLALIIPSVCSRIKFANDSKYRDDYFVDLLSTQSIFKDIDGSDTPPLQAVASHVQNTLMLKARVFCHKNFSCFNENRTKKWSLE